MYGLAHVTGGEPYDLHDLFHKSNRSSIPIETQKSRHFSKYLHGLAHVTGGEPAALSA